MIKKIIYLVLICFCPVITEAQSHTQKTEILILGTSHLQQIEDFKPSMLNNVIQKLDSMNFEVVCVEKMSGQLLYDIHSRNDSTYHDVINDGWGKTYLSLADTVQKVRNINFLDAEGKIGEFLKKKDLSENDRKELFYNYLAVTDLPSAALQYQYLCENKSLFLSGFDKYLMETIEENINTHNEYYVLAMPLAFHQQLNKLEAIDNFQDEALLFKYFPSFIQDYITHAEALNKIMEQPIYLKTQKLTEQGIGSNDFSKLYALLNSDEYITQDFNGQWKIWLETNFPSGSDRARYSLWEMRNLQISANILDVASRHPGKRILVIIGASHKGFLEKYLRQIEDIKLLKYND